MASWYDNTHQLGPVSKLSPLIYINDVGVGAKESLRATFPPPSLDDYFNIYWRCCQSCYIQKHTGSAARWGMTPMRAHADIISGNYCNAAAKEGRTTHQCYTLKVEDITLLADCRLFRTMPNHANKDMRVTVRRNDAAWGQQPRFNAFSAWADISLADFIYMLNEHWQICLNISTKFDTFYYLSKYLPYMYELPHTLKLCKNKFHHAQSRLIFTQNFRFRNFLFDS